ncbi:6-carboxy-5,6,7,8-tetrahydropterin synthase [hydrothermal vent metagenome]|uniref:6-carboxy-5,6,7,8-tetrahydropterin synthase n=1 Tax=hydrothermal vent metagenome TaxID=652676 RepID=A0A3B0WIF6_9ZZZZ
MSISVLPICHKRLLIRVKTDRIMRFLPLAFQLQYKQPIMPAKYTLKIVTDFASAHTLRDYPGACSRMHGHNWKVELELESSQLDAIGMAVDFKAMKKATNDVCDRLDHRYLNEIAPFTEINPTAENMAAWIFHEVGKKLNTDTLHVSSLTLWETERACVTYSE